MNNIQNKKHTTPVSDATISDELRKLFSEIFSIGKNGETSLAKAVFSNKRQKSLEYNKVMLRPILLGGMIKFQAEYSFPKKVTHANLSSDEAYNLAISLICDSFKQLNIFTNDGEIQVLAAKPQSPRFTRRAAASGGRQVARSATCPAASHQGSATCPAASHQGSATCPAASHQASAASPTYDPAAPCQVDSATASAADTDAAPAKLNGIASTAPTVSQTVTQPLSHNRSKNYIIPNGTACDFLIRLGVMDTNGKVFDRSYSKFRQINRYLEIVEDVFPYLPTDKTLKIIDFGCGKAYLTFALYHYLKILKNRDVEIIGLDLKEDVIDFCSKVAADLGYDELKFLKGDIADYSDDHADMVVTLHACDTATDYALINSVAWNTKVILSVPCCQHELFKQIKNELHRPMLKHGILKDRFTEYLTDGLRGLMLEASGYDVSMIEFTSLEHTARNIMIKAVKTNAAGAYAKKKCEAARQQYDELCEFYGVTPTIRRLGGN